MERGLCENGHFKWVLLGLGIVALESYRGETLSNAFRRGLENPRTRPFVIGVTALTVGHLFDLIPDNYDVYDYLGKTKSIINGKLTRGN